MNRRRLILATGIILGFGIALGLFIANDLFQESPKELDDLTTEVPAASRLQSTGESPPGKPKLKFKTIQWSDLRQLDYRTGKKSERLRKLESQIVKLPGFIVPLSDDLELFSEFLIVPDEQACIHVPPPPPNQMLYVKIKRQLPMNVTFYPLWFIGELEIVDEETQYGEAAYRLHLKKLELYR